MFLVGYDDSSVMVIFWLGAELASIRCVFRVGGKKEFLSCQLNIESPNKKAP